MSPGSGSRSRSPQRTTLTKIRLPPNCKQACQPMRPLSAKWNKHRSQYEKSSECLPVWQLPSPFFSRLLVSTLSTQRVGGEVADLGKPLDRAGFEKNDGGQRLADAGYAGQQTALRSGLDAFRCGPPEDEKSGAIPPSYLWPHQLLTLGLRAGVF